MNVVLVRAAESDERVLANLLHLYIHDFSEFLGVTPSEEGWFSYPALPLYWQEAGRTAFLIRAANGLAGFALVSKGSLISDDPGVFDLAEFFVVRGLRRHGVGRAAAHDLFRSFSGVWEVRVAGFNLTAQHFWRNVIEQYTAGRFTVETWNRHDGSRWNVFRFTSSDAGLRASAATG